MARIKLYLTHVISSFIFLAILIVAFSLYRDFIISVFTNPQKYFWNGLSTDDIHINIIFIFLTIVAVLVSYIFYLLLTFNTRSEIQILQATKSLTLSKEQFEWLYENAPVPYILIDRDAIISQPNKSTLRFFEVSPEEIAGKNLFSFVYPEDKEEAEKLFQYYKSNISVNRKEIRMITKSEAVRTVLLSIFVMKNPVNSKNSGLAMLFDVTEEKLLDKQKSEFVSLASHQLRTPLATAKWYTEMLISGDIGEVSEKQKEYLEKLHIANEEMVDLVDVLLNVSRIEMGTLPIDKKQTNVEEITESILADFSVEIERKGIRVEKKYNDNLKNIKSDPKLLRIVIQNLISNAIKYTPSGGGVSIIFEESLIKGKKIIISDSGIGIPKNAQSMIFTKLFRADNARVLENVSGTGLGLYLVKSIIGSMGGDLSFVSEENKGSIFTINL
jgi:PAS domain S-box-containing protein